MMLAGAICDLLHLYYTSYSNIMVHFAVWVGSGVV